jgi:hypothetical protein
MDCVVAGPDRSDVLDVKLGALTIPSIERPRSSP